MLFMKYQSFIKAVVTFVTANLPRDYFITVYPVRKNNNYIRDAFVVRGGNNSPAVYVMPYYRRYKAGVSLSQIQMEITEIFRQVCNSTKGLWNPLFCYDHIKGHLALQLVNYEENKIWLTSVPHRHFLDMAIIYYIAISYPDNQWGNIVVTKQIQQMWKQTEAELYYCAKRNTPQILPPVVSNLFDVVNYLQELDQMEAFSLTDEIRKNKNNCRDMYFISNKANYYGAVYLCYLGIWKKLAEQVHSNLAVTALSVHELVAVPFQKYGRWEIFQEIAERTYVTIPKPNERLSPSVYCFSRKTGKFSIIGGKKKGYKIWEE